MATSIYHGLEYTASRLGPDVTGLTGLPHHVFGAMIQPAYHDVDKATSLGSLAFEAQPNV